MSSTPTTWSAGSWPSAPTSSSPSPPSSAQAIADVTYHALGYRESRGRLIDPSAAANLLWPLVDPEGGVPVMAPYLTFRVTLAADGSPTIATFDSLDDARAFADMKSAQGERHVVRY